MSFNAISQLLHAAASGALATQSARVPGYPYASALPLVLDEQHRPIFLISRLAEHTANLLADRRASLLVFADGDDVLAHARLTLVGDVVQFEPAPELRARYLRYQSAAEQYLTLGDFAFFHFMPKRARFVAGFGRMGWLEEKDWTAAPVLPLADEAAIIEELLAGQPPEMRVLGLDRYGIDFVRDGVRARREFAGAPLAIDGLRGAAQRLLQMSFSAP